MADPVKAIDQLGVMIAKSGMFGCDNENAGKVLAMICMCERKSPTEIMRTYDIIGGKLRKKALASYAEFRAKGGRVKWLATGEDGQRATGSFTFEDQTIEISFTIEQARKGGAIFKEGSNWMKTPGNMLRARCLSNAIAMLCPEIFAGGDDEQDDAPMREIKMETDVPAPSRVVVFDKIEKPHSPTFHNTPSPQPATTPSPEIHNATMPMPAAVPTAEVAGASVSNPAAVSLLPDKVIVDLENILGAHAQAAGAWLLKEKWLQPGQGLAHLTLKRASSILNRPAEFIRAITTVAK